MNDQPRALTDLFKCVPYNARISAASCIKRQEIAADTTTGVNTGWGRDGGGSKGAKADVTLCIGCEIGANVLRGLEGKPPVGEAPESATITPASAPAPLVEPGRLQRCTSCGTRGHNARSCPERKGREPKPAAPKPAAPAKPKTTPNERLRAGLTTPVAAAVLHPSPTGLVPVHPDILPEADDVDRLIAQRASVIDRLATERAQLKQRLERVEEQLRQLTAFTSPAT